jgi:hypothetical protein
MIEPVKLKRFGIYHPKDGFINMVCKPDICEYEYVAHVEAENLVRVFYMAQNDLNPEYAKHGKRSTSVGDIVTFNKQVFMYKGVGFRRIPKTHDLYKKIMETDEAIIEVLSRKTLTEEQVQDLLDNCV